MTTYLAFLRGINVGGRNKIKMAELRHSLEEAGLQEVVTYIQSGNIIFRSDVNEDNLVKLIVAKLQTDFNLAVPVVIRTEEEIKGVRKRCPFTNEDITQAQLTSAGESLYVGLLGEEPAQTKTDWLLSYQTEDDRCYIDGRNVYLLFSKSIRNSKLANHLLKMNVPATIRNWKTISKLAQMAEEH
ncbi:DUF1697 domain-containing protein [Halobacillus rhizosphaerae]|uniref:DUF1697 domain-containing protein n=1 Tax=Halobacillus rhizosphaerae TaxID=3064889 RepID=UPI00398B94A4